MKFKICGIRNLEMLQICNKKGVLYGGINFVPTSKRFANDDFLEKLSKTSAIKYVGVFQNQPLKEVITCIKKYNLKLVQLHGDETLTYIKKINVPVIKAFSLRKREDLENLKKYLNKVAIILLDGPTPGKGKVVDLDLLEKTVNICRQANQPYAVAGGINIDNIEFFLDKYADAEFFDIASGVEDVLGEFSELKLGNLINEVLILSKLESSKLSSTLPIKSFVLSDFPNVTPLNLFASLRKKFGAPAVLFESAVQNEINRISVVACDPVQTLEISEDICLNLRKILKKCHNFSKNPYFSGGLMGGLTFESVFDFFPKYAPKHQEDLPRTLMYEFGLVCIFDHSKNLLTVLQHPQNQCQNVVEILKKIELIETTVISTTEENSKSKKTEEQNPKFMQSVAAAQKAIYEGEVFQLVLSHTFEQKVPSQIEIPLYSALKELEPTTHLVLADYAQHGIYACASPEIIGKKVGSHLLVTPIAGTRRRKETVSENELVEKNLMADPKENAEHDMLVDLGRNDLGRISKTGSISVTKYKYLQAYKHVIHLLSNIEAEIDSKYDEIDFLRSIFPAGTLSGAPKLRAVKLIQKLEFQSRGFYGGATGLIDTKGDLQMAINIRGVHLHNGQAKIQVGAGIVKDSIPKNEWQELENKSQTIRNVISSLICSQT
jgi:anthranilate synthase component 1